MNVGELAAQLEGMRSLGHNATTRQLQQRGRDLEAWLNSLLSMAGLDPRTSYRPEGEEIDGSFVLDGRVLLLEAKWTKTPPPASSIYAFKAKVDGKLSGTLGVFVSMAGFSKDSIDALVKGKDLNVILVGDEDVEESVKQGIDVVLRRKLRAAAEEGSVYFPIESQYVDPNTFELPEATLAHSSATLARQRLLVVVESREDRLVAARFAGRVMADLDLPTVTPTMLVAPFGIDVVTAGGFANLPSTAAALLGSLSDETSEVVRTMILADSDYDHAGGRRSALLADERVRDLGVDVVVAEPTVTTEWVGTEPDLLDLESYLRVLADVSITDLRARSHSFARFYEIIEQSAARAHATTADPPS